MRPDIRENREPCWLAQDPHGRWLMHSAYGVIGFGFSPQETWGCARHFLCLADTPYLAGPLTWRAAFIVESFMSRYMN